ncbi:MAG TPA: tetratricopeptide repeat protein [Desulfobacterales bacterium]|jgi:tetratricopeptide (TPR) repeat protein|nr:tetratricopeptide repeat protein [Desulfobacterales bacterium]
MTAKTARSTNNLRCTLAALAAALFLAACQKPLMVHTPTDRPPPPRPAIGLPEPAPPAAPTPQQKAARQLTEEGRKLLAADRPDDAITVLERALSLDAENGRNYYFLGEAWLQKGNLDQAREFNRLAELHFRGDPEWLKSVARQRGRIAAGKR